MFFSEQVADHRVMMSIAIDAVAAKHSGAGVVAQGIVAAAIDHAEVGRVTVFASRKKFRDFDFPSSPKLSVVEVPVDESIGRRLVWAFVGLRRAVQHSSADAILGLGNSQCRIAGVATVTFVQQSVPFSPEALARYPLLGRLRMKLIGVLLRRAARLSDRVIVQTGEMRRALMAVAGINQARIAVCPPPTPTLPPSSGVDQSVANAALYVGNASPYKNIRVLVDAMALFREAGSNLTLTAVGPGMESHATQHQFRGLPMAGRNEIAQLYRSSTFLVMPSLVETVGLPMLEAMASGLPVLAADRAYAHEICGDAAMYFDPLDANSLAAAATRLAADAQFRAALSERGSARIRARTGVTYKCVVDEVLVAAGKLGRR